MVWQSDHDEDWVPGLHDDDNTGSVTSSFCIQCRFPTVIGKHTCTLRQFNPAVAIDQSPKRGRQDIPEVQDKPTCESVFEALELIDIPRNDSRINVKSSQDQIVTGDGLAVRSTSL